jgi:hypothetical protein
MEPVHPCRSEAQEPIRIRDRAIHWIEATLDAPDSLQPDPRQPDRSRSYKANFEHELLLSGLPVAAGEST